MHTRHSADITISLDKDDHATKPTDENVQQTAVFAVKGSNRLKQRHEKDKPSNPPYHCFNFFHGIIKQEFKERSCIARRKPARKPQIIACRQLTIIS